MDILVCINVVPDTTTKITFTENNTKFNSEGVQFIINPYDELSLTRALEITEKLGGKVTVIHVGTSATDPVIRKALAIGATEAVRIDAEPIDGMFVARQITEFAKTHQYDLILTGRESIDYNGGQVGGLIAEMLGIPFINVVMELETDGNHLTATRDIDGGREDLKSALPCLVSAQKDLCEPRIPNMRGIMQARTKPLEVIEAVASETNLSYSLFELPPAKSGVKLIEAENAEQLIDLLHEEKKLI
jgi:electron transfer flavoprotein beta subunit